MNKQQALAMMGPLFSEAFDEDRYRQFIKQLLNDFEPRNGGGAGPYIPEPYRNHVQSYKRFGKYVDPEGNEIDLLIVKVKSFNKLARARTALRNFAINRLKQHEKQASLIAFYAADDEGQDWRFSFVKYEDEAVMEGGKAKLKRELTPARRYSFLVGANENSHTAVKQLLPIVTMDYANPSIEEIEAAFSIEKVTDEFFEQYKALFLRLTEHLKEQEYFQDENQEQAQERVSRFAKKLLGQIVFLYFLQKKGWLGVAEGQKWGSGSRQFMRDGYNRIAVEAGQNYYQDWLRFLFYEALACERKDQADASYYARFECRIPFLNGGLFEADHDWQRPTIPIPNALFSNDEKTKAGDRGTGILDVFDRYNFTIKEDEPLEKEVAVDPEMLGKVFENMLEIKERKSKGAFYTPREIVHYMCQESLIYYLDSMLNQYKSVSDTTGGAQGSLFAADEPQEVIRVPRSDLEKLIRNGHLALENDQRVIDKKGETKTYKFQLPESVRNHAPAIDTALAEIKTCDPAIGSGAFPVGLLHEIVTARLVLAPHCQNQTSAYELKRHAIGESIYGVDIDASAIDIARLRLWLSLIVDEDDYDEIKALPNLDYKIMQGDSLLGIEQDLFNMDLLKGIEEHKRAYFNTSNHKEKVALATKIESQLKELTKGSERFDFEIYFSEVWHHKGGFDIVIGNPPYKRLQEQPSYKTHEKWLSQQFKTFAKQSDLYCLFYEKGYGLLRAGGNLAFITSNKWMLTAYGKKLRSFLLESTCVKQIIDFGDSQIFSGAAAYPNILIYEKSHELSVPDVWDLASKYKNTSSLIKLLISSPPGIPLLEEGYFIIASSGLKNFMKTIEMKGVFLKSWEGDINYGIKTGLNSAFLVDGSTKDQLIAKDEAGSQLLKPIIRGRDIKRYHVENADNWLLNVHNGFGDSEPVKIDDYPAIKEHLDGFMPKLASRQDKGYTPYNLRSCAYLDSFNKPKLVWLEMSPRPNFVYIGNEAFLLNTAYMLTGEKLKWILAILNSQVMDIYFSLISTDVRGNTRRYFKQYVEMLPIIEYQEGVAPSLETLVDYTQFAKSHQLTLQSTFFEQLIDGIVYELYFPDELQAANKQILPHIGELKPIDDDMDTAQKKAVIQQEFERLYDPRHPVRNNLETLDSVEVVKIVRDALKRK